MTNSEEMMLEEVIAQEALLYYDFSPDAQLTLVNVSENTTFRVDDPAMNKSAAVRVHRPNYHTHAAIESELQWMDALRSAGVADPPRPLLSRNGNRTLRVQIKGETARSVVLFEWLSGEAPTTDGDLVSNFRMLGSLASRMHVHGQEWQRPASFKRYTVDYETALGPHALWGRWQDGLGMGTSEVRLLTSLNEEIKRRLSEYGNSPDRFGLAHNDLRLANLLSEDNHTHVIDFDDCGFAWYMYDFASAVSFIEDDPRVTKWMNAWLEGYEKHRNLTMDDYEIIPTLVLFRRLILVGWVGSHFEYAEEAAELGSSFTEATCDLASVYLQGRFLQ